MKITKSNQTMSTDSAVWYIEALLNYQFALIDGNELETNTTYSDSIVLDAKTDSEIINLREISEIYNTLKENISKNFDKFLEPNKNIGLINIEYLNNKFVAYSYFDYFLYNEKTTTGFNTGWRYGRLLGDCSGNYMLYRDAASEIDSYLHKLHPNATAKPGYIWTNINIAQYNDIRSSQIINYGNVPVNPHGFHSFFFIDIRLPKDDPYFVTQCITAEEMDWYAENSWEAVTRFKNHCDSFYVTLDFIRYNVIGYPWTDPVNENIWNTHAFPLKYGTTVYMGLPH